MDSEWDEPMRCRKRKPSPIGVPGNVGYIPPVWDDFISCQFPLLNAMT